MGKDWKKITYRKYNGNYEKTWYDIICFDLSQFEMCWPNAGTFHTTDGAQIKGEDVEFFRLSKKHPMEVD